MRHDTRDTRQSNPARARVDLASRWSTAVGNGNTLDSTNTGKREQLTSHLQPLLVCLLHRDSSAWIVSRRKPGVEGTNAHAVDAKVVTETTASGSCSSSSAMVQLVVGFDIAAACAVCATTVVAACIYLYDSIGPERSIVRLFKSKNTPRTAL